MKSKLTLHCQRVDEATRAWLLRAKPGFVKLVDPTPGDCAWVKAHLPGCRIIGRVTDLPADPALAAKRIVGADSATLGAVDYHELWNEPGGSADDLRTLNANTLVVLSALPSRFKVLVGSLAQGNPPTIADFALLAPAIREAKRRGGGVATHEYDAPTMATSGEYRIGRFRLLRATLPTDLRDVDWYVTEFGLDGGCLTPPLQDTGWEHFTDEAGLLAQIKMAEQRYYADPQIKAVCAFTAGAYTPWNKPGQSFEMAGTAKIAAYVGDSGASTPTPPAEPSHRHPPPLGGKPKTSTGGPMPDTFTVGAGIKAKMTEQGDAPKSNEHYVSDFMAVAFGAKGMYVYSKEANQTFFLRAS